MSQSHREQPDATDDLQCARADIDDFGYCLLKGALSPDELAAIRTRLLEQKEAEEQLGVEYHGEDKKQLIKSSFFKHEFVQSRHFFNAWWAASKKERKHQRLTHMFT